MRYLVECGDEDREDCAARASSANGTGDRLNLVTTEISDLSSEVYQ